MKNSTRCQVVCTRVEKYNLANGTRVLYVMKDGKGHVMNWWTRPTTQKILSVGGRYVVKFMKGACKKFRGVSYRNVTNLIVEKELKNSLF